jgi:hypothetical protein
MSRRLCALVGISSLIILARHAGAQQPAVKDATGTVVGNVFYGDTNRPARLAMVSLLPVREVSDFDPKAKSDPAKPIGPGMNVVETSLDGSFSAPNVKPGTYYVIAEKQGYLSPMEQFTTDDLNHPTPEVKKQIDKTLQKVTVEPHAATSVEVRLERAAAISGTVSFDDGGPAASLPVQALRKRKDGKWAAVTTTVLSMQAREVRTDDEGHYRISGLSPGTYMVEADLALRQKLLTALLGGASSSFDMERFFLATYSGGVFRQRDGALFTLEEAEQRTGEDIVIPVTKLHSVAGTIVSAHDGHVVNAGNLRLLHSDDQTEQAAAVVDKDDANFHFEFVPEGDYILEAKSAGDVVHEEVPNCPRCFPSTQTVDKPVHDYGPAQKPLNVHSETVGVTIAVPEKDGKAGNASAANEPAR